MKGLDNDLYVTLLIMSNLAAIVHLLVSLKWPRAGRVMFFFLFAWASWTNWTQSRLNPEVYLEYADLTWSGFYRRFIEGWFAGNIPEAVAVVATCQGLIATSMLLRSRAFQTGAVGAILFLVAITPLGIGAGFPSTLVMAATMGVLLKKDNGLYIWQRPVDKKNLSGAERHQVYN